MKKIILITFILFSSLFVYSQTNKKNSYNVFLNIGGASSKVSQAVEYSPFIYTINDTAGRVYFFTEEQLYNKKTIKNDISKLSLLFNVGARVNYNFKKNLFLVSGIGVSAFKIVRNVAKSSSSRVFVVDTSNNRTISQGGYILPRGYTSGGIIGSGLKLGVNEFSSYYETQHSFSFFTLDIPIGLQYHYRKFKFEQGVDASIILSTKNIGKNLYEDPERTVPIPQFANSIKSYFNYYGGIDYSVSKKIAIGVNYKIGLTDALQANELSSLKLNSFGLRISYNIK
jgi:hypothetical protein